MPEAGVAHTPTATWQDRGYGFYGVTLCGGAIKLYVGYGESSRRNTTTKWWYKLNGLDSKRRNYESKEQAQCAAENAARSVAARVLRELGDESVAIAP